MSARGRRRGERPLAVGGGVDGDRRGQANLVAVAVALVLVTSVLGASLAVAESVLVGATTARDAGDRLAATTLAERLVSHAPKSYPANTVPNGTALTTTEVETLAPVVDDAAVRVELDGRTLVARGDTTEGVTVYRGVLLATPQARRLVVDLDKAETVTLPHRVRDVRLSIRPGPNTTVRTVRVNDRVVLHNETGLTGSARVNTSIRRTTELAFEASATYGTVNRTAPSQPGQSQPKPTPDGRVVVSYRYLDTEPATLAVTVDG